MGFFQRVSLEKYFGRLSLKALEIIIIFIAPRGNGAERPSGCLPSVVLSAGAPQLGCLGTLGWETPTRLTQSQGEWRCRVALVPQWREDTQGCVPTPSAWLAWGKRPRAGPLLVTVRGRAYRKALREEPRV